MFSIRFAHLVLGYALARGGKSLTCPHDADRSAAGLPSALPDARRIFENPEKRKATGFYHDIKIPGDNLHSFGTVAWARLFQA